MCSNKATTTMDKTTTFDKLAPASGRECADRSGHPLEVIAFFRRFKPGVFRDLIYTLIWNSAFAAAFTVFFMLFEPEARVARVLWVNFVIANCIGYLIHGGFALANPLFGARIGQRGFALRTLYYAAVSLVGVFAGYWLAFKLLNWREAQESVFAAKGAITILLLGLIISAILAAIFLARERQARAEAAFQRERARVEAAEHQFHLAQLKLLEAQIEPHFLYNTLANVISLVDADPGGAKRMLERLIDYLRRASAASTTAAATLGTQAELLRAYLDLIVLRMGRRLSYRIDVPEELASVPLPPMLLQPLAENAIKHGLEPKVAGGEVTVGARRDGATLVLTVQDDGDGFRATRPDGPGGLGLANLRARLATLYGERARLIIEDAHPGTRASVELPMESPR
jgi:two-component sensor histidine kinase